MKKYTLSKEIENALGSIKLVRVQEIAKELSGYGLAVAMPHLHEQDEVNTLPTNIVQYENDLHVSFLNKEQFEKNQKNAFPVMWRFDRQKSKIETCAWCHSE